MESGRQNITTIAINWDGLPFKVRLKNFVWLIKQPYNLRKELSKEYAEWTILGIFQRRWQAIAYLLDHYVLWGGYCLKALIFSSAHGFRWSIPDKGCMIYGIRVNPYLF